MNTATSFGQWLKERRQSLNLTQENLADRVGCALSTIEKIERGLRRASHQVAGRIAEELRIPTEEQAAFVAWARTLPSDQRELQITVPQPTRGGSEGVPGFPPGNLPAPTTALIGRDRELAETRSLLQRQEVRLLTLLGPPGIGKTRLSLALADSLRGDFDDGVWFVPLASISDPALVVSSINRALSLKETPVQGGSEALQAFLRGRDILLVLDNFEQVVLAAPAVAELLAWSLGLKVLVTSRAALQIYGEHHFDVPPLDLPDLKNLPAEGDLQNYPAVALFAQRAQAVAPRFSVSKENSPAIAEICARLDGLPLAIELAAARSKLFDPLSILRRLDRRLPLLSGGPQDRTPRQQSLRSAIAWSYDLLNEAEKRLFRHLSVFVGGCTLESIEAIGGVSEPSGLGQLNGSGGSTPEDVLDSLVNKSLLQCQDVDGEIRFSMLETLREYAGERLREHDEEEAARQQHAAYFVALAEEAEPRLRGTEQQKWLDRLDKEHDNLRAALNWAFEKGQSECAQRLAGAVWRFWSMRSYFVEGRKWLTKVLETWPQNTSWRLKVGLGAGGLAQSQSDYVRARLHLEESLRGARELGDRLRTALALNNLGIIDRQQGNLEAARSKLLEAIEIERELDDKWSMAGAYTNLGLVASDMGDYAESRSFHEQSLAIFRELGDRRSTAVALINLGDAIYHQGDLAQAQLLWEECGQIFRDLGEKQGLAQTLVNLAFLARDKKDLAKGYSLLAEIISLYRQIGRRKLLAEALDYAGTLAALSGQPERAARLFGSADGLFRELGITLPQDVQQSHMQYETLAREALGDEVRFDALWREWSSKPVEEAILYAEEVFGGEAISSQKGFRN
jgi:predicted ATPase/DNA-binding XRE family transcriptional regulator